MDDTRLLAEYEKFFASESVRLARITDKTIDIATTLRVKHRSLKTPDAIHLATAIEQQADVFLTGDKDLLRSTEVNVEII